MKRLLIYLKRHPLATLFAPLFKMLEASFELFVPLVVAKMIDIGIYQKNAGYLWRMGALLVLLGIIGFGFAITAQYFAAKSAVSTGRDLRNDLFAHINTLSFKEIDTLGTSTLINRMTNDVNQVQNGINMFLRLFLRSPFVVFGAMVMAFTVDVKAAIPFVIVIPALAVVVFAILLITMPLYKNVQKQLDDVLLSTRENLLGIRVVRAFNRQESEMESFEKKSLQLFFRQIHVGKISALLNPVTYVIINLGIIAILWSGGNQVYLGRLTQGQVIALINYMSQILVELIKLANLIILLSKAIASLNRVNNIFDMQPSIKEEGAFLASKTPIGSVAGTAAVEFSNVSFSYNEKAKEVLSNITFKAMSGQTIGIIGGTGSGKSSLVNLIPRFYDIQNGSVKVDGSNVKTLNPVSIRKHIGMVPQKAQLFKGTLRENMRWGRKNATDEEIYQALEIAQAKEFVDSKDQGLDLMIEQNGSNLSGGQRQRVWIAMALAQNTKILLLDEPTTYLDVRYQIEILRLVKKLNTEYGITIIMVLHDINQSIAYSDCIIAMKDGKILAEGNPNDVINEELIKNVYGIELSVKRIGENKVVLTV